MELSVRYNQGFLDIDKIDANDVQRNTSVMLNVNIPIGSNKAKEKKKEEDENKVMKRKLRNEYPDFSL